MSSAFKLDPQNEQAKAEIIAAEGLRASHEIITVLEKCKSSSEHILDQLPDLLVIMSLDGRILKGNLAAARLMGVENEDILNKNLFDVFHVETRNIMKSRISSLLKDRNLKQQQFELPIINKDSQQVEHLWTVSLFTQISERRGPLIKVLGKDISKIKEFEKKLSQIFSAIPLGIFTVDSNGNIEWPYSLFTEYLLGQDKLADMPLDEVLFKPMWDSLDSIEKTGAGQVVDCIGGDTLWFDMAKLHFPKEVRFTRETPDGVKACWLGITYHPIVHENKIEKLMIVLEDRTEVVEARRALELQREIENNKIKKILEIQNCSGSLLEVTFSDFDLLFPRMSKECEDYEPEKVARTLHGIKGIARTAGFSDLEHHVHACEDKLLSSIADENIDRQWLTDTVNSLKNEWHELRSLCFALSGRQHGLQIKQVDYMEVLHELKELRTNLDEEGRRHADKILEKLGGGQFAEEVELATLEPKLEKQLNVTASTLDKKIDLRFDWEGVNVIQNEILTFSEIFLHLLNNSIDHGVESPSERKKLGKDETGTITFHAELRQKHVHIEVSDDGRGIDKDKILKIAIEKEMITQQQASKLKSDEDILELMLLPGFSTKKEADTISGRGIGLDSVNDAVKALGCTKLNIKSEINKGTTFVFDVPLTTVD